MEEECRGGDDQDRHSLHHPQKLQLFADFHQHGHDTKRWPRDEAATLQLFLFNPFATEEWSYYLGDRLIGIGYVDALPQGLSAIYFYWDPSETRRFARHLQHSADDRRGEAATAAARLPRILCGGVPIDGIQGAVPAERGVGVTGNWALRH